MNNKTIAITLVILSIFPTVYLGKSVSTSMHRAEYAVDCIVSEKEFTDFTNERKLHWDSSEGVSHSKDFILYNEDGSLYKGKPFEEFCNEKAMDTYKF